MRIPWIVVLVALALPGGEATATSCTPLVERYFVVCVDDACETVFAINDVRAFGACARRIDVADVDPAIGDYVAALARRARRAERSGLYRLDARRGRGLPSASVEILQQRLSFWGLPRDWLVREAEALPSSVAAVRSRYVARARKEWLDSAAGHVVTGGALALFVLLFAESMRTFVADVFASEKRTSDRSVAVLVQTATLGVAVAMASVDDTLTSVALLIVPGALMIFFCETWLAFRERHRRSA